MLTKTFLFCCVYLSIRAIEVFSFSKVKHDADGTIVRIESGEIKGHILKSEKGNDYWAFQEIPYAAPPVGKNRFQPPIPPTSWKGILNTTRNTKICYQTTSMFSDLEITEDCLYINVYTPVKPGCERLLPVLVWIHGGSYIFGSGAYEYYGPKYIMDQEVVVVTINYRLGALGRLGTDDGVIPSRLGMRDQLFAMKWIHRNIQLFGGNKSQVTIAGESSGSVDVGNHLLGPWENNVQLFHAVIMQSGSPLAGLQASRDNGTEVAVELAQAINPTFTPTNTHDLLKFLQQANAKDILAAGITGINVAQPQFVGSFQQFIDGNYKKVPVLIGFNSEEFLYGKYLINETTLAQVDANVSALISSGVNMTPEDRAKAGRLYRNLYTNNSTFINNLASYIRYGSDAIFTTAICKQVELASATVPYYLYQFSYKGELGGQMSNQGLSGTENVSHAEDLHYMWEENGFNSDLAKFPKTDKLAIHRFVKMWTNFVKYFNPTPVHDRLLDSIRWLPSEPNSLRYLNINTTLEMRRNPRQYKDLKPILETYMRKPFNFFN